VPGLEASPDPLADEDVEPVAGFPDPLEPMNRLTLRLNLGIDRWFMGPLTRSYQFVVPAPARRAVRRVLTNLNSPSIFVNDLLQLEPGAACVTAFRFGINTSFGLVGIFDVADKLGIEGHASDFGQTLALVGLPSGPFLMLPVVGPTTARDGTGYLVDFLFRPTTYVLTPLPLIVLTSITEGSAGLAARDAHDEGMRALEAASIDYYAALRNAFYQDRIAQIWKPGERTPRVALAMRALRRPFGASGGEVVDLSAEARQ
jgi:phospholipid-binding lipoprotein MlaA